MRAKRSRGEAPFVQEEPQFVQGGQTQSGHRYSPTENRGKTGVSHPRPSSPNQTFADGLMLGEQEEILNQWPPEPMFQMPADEIIADWDTQPPNHRKSTQKIPCLKPGGNQLSITMTST